MKDKHGTEIKEGDTIRVTDHLGIHEFRIFKYGETYPHMTGKLGYVIMDSPAYQINFTAPIWRLIDQTVEVKGRSG